MGDVSRGAVDESAAVLLACCEVAEAAAAAAMAAALDLDVRGEGISCGSCSSSGLAPDDELTPLLTTANRLAWSSSAILLVRRTTTGERRCAAETGRSVRG